MLSLFIFSERLIEKRLGHVRHLLENNVPLAIEWPAGLRSGDDTGSEVDSEDDDH